MVETSQTNDKKFSINKSGRLRSISLPFLLSNSGPSVVDSFEELQTHTKYNIDNNDINISKTINFNHIQVNNTK
jgi:hypothetical protein